MPITVTLQPGYTKKDLFLAAIRVQLENYHLSDESESKHANNARIFESPSVRYLDGDAIEISTNPHTSDAVTIFNQLTKTASHKYVEWREVYHHYPFQWDMKDALNMDLSVFTKQQLADYLVSFITLFKEFWKDIESILKQKEDMQMSSSLILSLAVFLKSMLTPMGPLSSEELCNIHTLFSNIENKVLDMNFMTPPPTNTIESCCDAVLRLVSQMMTQPIGHEIAYGSMLGADREKYLPSEILNMKYGSETYKEFNFPDHYIIPDRCFKFPETIDDTQFLWQFFSRNHDFLKQIDPQHCSSELLRVTMQRLWDAFVQDARCPAWIKNKNSEEYFAEKISPLKFQFIINLSFFQAAKKDHNEQLFTLAEKLFSPAASVNAELFVVRQRVLTIQQKDVKEAMLIILNSLAPNEEKLRSIGAIAVGKCQRLTWRDTATRKIYDSLSIFYATTVETLTEKLAEFEQNRSSSPVSTHGFWRFASPPGSPRPPYHSYLSQ